MNTAALVESLLEDADLLAVADGFARKLPGETYAHSKRVAARVSGDAKIVALLHDVVEDHAATEQELLGAGIPKELVRSVLAVTRNPGEEYSAFIRRAGQDALGKVVKVADLTDNLTRGGGEKYAGLRKRYLAAFRVLTGHDFEG